MCVREFQLVTFPCGVTLVTHTAAPVHDRRAMAV